MSRDCSSDCAFITKRPIALSAIIFEAGDGADSGPFAMPLAATSGVEVSASLGILVEENSAGIVGFGWFETGAAADLGSACCWDGCRCGGSSHLKHITKYMSWVGIPAQNSLLEGHNLASKHMLVVEHVVRIEVGHCVLEDSERNDGEIDPCAYNGEF